MTRVFPGFLTPVLTQLFFPESMTTFLTCFCRGKRRKYVRKKSHLNWRSNSQPPGHESDTLTTEPLGCGRSQSNMKVLHFFWHTCLIGINLFLDFCILTLCTCLKNFSFDYQGRSYDIQPYFPLLKCPALI